MPTLGFLHSFRHNNTFTNHFTRTVLPKYEGTEYSPESTTPLILLSGDFTSFYPTVFDVDYGVPSIIVSANYVGYTGDQNRTLQ